MGIEEQQLLVDSLSTNANYNKIICFGLNIIQVQDLLEMN